MVDTAHRICEEESCLPWYTAFLSIMNLNYTKFHLKFTEYIITVPGSMPYYHQTMPEQAEFVCGNLCL